MTRRKFLNTSAKLSLAGLASVSAFGGLSFAATKGEKMQFTTLNNGVKMPMVGLGTAGLSGSGLSGKEGQKTMESAIKIGYRLIDTAQMYGNEADVGAAVANSKVARAEFFITTKLSSDMSYEETFKSFDESLKKLRLDYLDLLLIHNNYPNAKQMYKAMEKLYEEGRIKAIGISNFNAKAYEDFVKSCKVIPAVNQCQTHIFYQQQPLRKAMQKRGTVLEAWSPFVAGRNNFFKNETLMKIASKYNKTVAQITLRFLVEEGIVVIPKSSNEGRLRENYSIFDFNLDEADKKIIVAMDTNKSSFSWVD
ncbi:aldo/keto reductase [Campylobacter troglodytis]|uniref:aldo/keto reductase n=1 Tax=Campylobacter troglodytis TaxID=654363 RepID=UPI001FE4B1DD|nr:aldo/keto reductase [Campylobacter troglodytis]